MSSGLNNKLVGQIGEFLVCAELGRQGLIATPFAGNVPAFDVLAVDEMCRAVPIQVKASTGGTWQTDARNWMNIIFEPPNPKPNEVVRQRISPTVIPNPSLIYVHVRVAQTRTERDQFWILTKAELQTICTRVHTEFIQKHDGQRPKNSQSCHLAYNDRHLAEYEDKWQLVRDQMAHVPQAINLAIA